MADSTETRLKSLDENKLMIIRKLFGTIFVLKRVQQWWILHCSHYVSIRFFFCYFVHKLHFLKIIFNFDHISCVYTLRLIWPIPYPGECDLMVHTRSTASFCHEGVLFSNLVPRVFRKYPGYEVCSVVLLPSYVYNMHEDTKSEIKTVLR